MGRIIAPSRTLFPRNGLTAFWNLEDASSSTPVPAQFGNFSLTRFGSAYTSITGKIEKGFEFGNSSQGLWTNQQLWNLLTNPTSFSVSFWHKIPDNTQPPFTVMGNSFGSMGFHFDYYNFGHGYDGTSDLNWIPGSYGISFRMSGPGGPYKWNAVFANEATPNNTWTLVTATYDLPTTTMKLYLNGVLKSTYNNAVIGLNSEPSWHGFALNGTVVNGGKQYGANQCFDALGFWSRALDQSEISNLYNNGNGIQFNLLNSISIKKQNLGGGKLNTSLVCSYQNINKLVEIDGISPIGQTFNNIAFDYASFASNCSSLGLDPTTILNDLGGVDFNYKYVVIRAKTANNFNTDSISDLGNGIINITSIGPSSGTFANRYRFFVMCKNGWNTVRFYGVDYSI